jgi:antitoxin component of MazEF toxin-antitoxin module
MEAKIRKIGNSLGIYFPREALLKAGFTENQVVHLSVRIGEIVISADSVLDIPLSSSDAKNLLNAIEGNALFSDLEKILKSKLSES